MRKCLQKHFQQFLPVFLKRSWEQGPQLSTNMNLQDQKGMKYVFAPKNNLLAPKGSKKVDDFGAKKT